MRFRAAAVALAISAALAACAARAIAPSSLRVFRPDLSSPLEDAFPRGEAPRDPVSSALWERINRDRRDHGLPPVLWDERAASAARRTTRRQVEERTDGHFLLDGFPPYARLSAAADFGMGAENAAAFMSDAGTLHDTAQGLALRAQAEMMKETPPRDSHRRAVLDPAATHVGIGWAMAGGEFRLGVEFTSRGYERLRVRTEARRASVEVDGAALPELLLRYATVAREPAPKPISRREANGRDSYSYPAAELMLLPEGSRERGVGIRSVHRLSSDSAGRFFFSWDFDAPGLWTFILYFQHPGVEPPRPGGSITVLVGER
ncbi:MAG TPA: CAP domain-containing protein [Thermoanaerobaculia bacterium]|nr:CAP domain-containing protein [Thermoanaerobaculia bacterium]